ncbi:MAG: phosphoribosylanthranilate isomerase [Phycisphaerae bacterium]|nr:phosphoribosylanthranilate isomerase [Phycisphaerae bacterium]
MRTRIKICGVMRAEDALAAARAGVDAVGIVLHHAARRGMNVDAARQIIAALPPYTTPVGLFVDSTAEEIDETSRRVGVRHVQLHGSESPEVAAKLPHLVFVKAIRLDRDTLSDQLAAWRNASDNVRGLVLETAGTGQAGGSGVSNDWELAKEAKEHGLFDAMPIIAAGGLTPENVGPVIRALRPWAVDVSSGVEETFGEKSTVRVDAFVKAVAKADALRN